MFGGPTLDSPYSEQLVTKRANPREAPSARKSHICAPLPVFARARFGRRRKPREWGAVDDYPRKKMAFTRMPSSLRIQTIATNAARGGLDTREAPSILRSQHQRLARAPID